MYIINCSWVIKAGWFVIKAFLDAKTVSKISIHGSNYAKELLQHVAPENLPDFLGGTCKCSPAGCLNQFEGPWKALYDTLPSEYDETALAFPPFPQKWPVP